jgi:serine protease Do
VTTALLLGGASLTLATGLPAGAQVAQNDAQKMQTIVPRAGAPGSFADLVDQLQPAVVNIATRQKVQVRGGNPFAGTPLEGMFPGGNGPQTREAQALGSGFVVSPDGFIVTNNHVITMDGQGVADSITIKFADGNEYPARIVGRDAASDIAVLKVDAGKALPFVKFGESSKARAGDWVLAIGNPFGLGGSVTTGIVSSVDRNTGAGAYDHFIQSDASINSGNSGGPMFDMQGNVIGINNWIIAPGGGNIGIGFAIPSDTAKPIVEKLRGGKEIERGYLGVDRVPVNEDTADALGIPHNQGEFVRGVTPGQGAANAGIQAGDVVMRIDGKQITPESSLSTIIANTAPGTRVRIELLREGKPRTVTALVGKRPSDEELAKQNFDPRQERPAGPAQPAPVPQASSMIEQSLGMSVIPLTADIAVRLGVREDTKGLAVTVVDPSSDAGTKGLQRGFIILSANNKPVTTAAELEAEVRAVQRDGRKAILLRVQPPGQAPVFVPIRLR